jgi:hypothetical protein
MMSSSMSMIIMSTMTTMSVIIMRSSSMTMIIMSASVPMIIMSTTHLMKLDTIRCIFFFSVESDMGEIVPDRESHSTHQIGEEELVEHEDDPEWYDRILMRYDIGKYLRSTHYLGIIWNRLDPCKKSSNLKYIRLFDHIDQCGCESKYHKNSNHNKLYRIDRTIRCLSDHESSMYRKEYSKDKYEVYRNTHDHH